MRFGKNLWFPRYYNPSWYRTFPSLHDVPLCHFVVDPLFPKPTLDNHWSASITIVLMFLDIHVKESYSMFCSAVLHSCSAHWRACLAFCTLVSSSYVTLYKGKIFVKSTSCACANLLKHTTSVDSILLSMWYKLGCSSHLDKPHSTSGHEIFNLLQH